MDAEPESEPESERESEPESEPASERAGSAAAYASNWRTVLVVDALVGVAVMIAGVVLAIAWNPVGGGFIGSLGLVYVAFVARRARTWAELRRRAGF